MDETIGNTTLFLVYGSFTAFNLLSSTVLRLLGVYRTLLFSSFSYVLFTLVLIHPIPFFLYPIAVICGCCAATLWTGMGTYLAGEVEAHDLVNGLVVYSSVGSFNGIFFGVNMFSFAFGNLVAAVFFEVDVGEDLIFLLMAVIVGFGSLSLLFLKVPPKDTTEETGITKHVPRFATTQLLETLNMSLKNGTMKHLILPFITTGATKSFIWGNIPPLIHQQNTKFYVMAFNGLSAAVFSVIFGRLAKRYGSVYVTFNVFPFLLTICCVIYFLVGSGGEGDSSLAIVWWASGVLGLVDGSLTTLSNAMVGELFPKQKEAGFATMVRRETEVVVEGAFSW